MLFFIFHFSFFTSSFAQEVLLPLQILPPSQRIVSKEVPQSVTLPFFDDFSNAAFPLSSFTFHLSGGATTSSGARLRPPTVGVVTLDAIDATGNLYPQASSSLFTADTLTSLPIRLDGLTSADAPVLSFYYLPGGGEDDLWQRVGDAPNPQDSLLLEFFRPADSTWTLVWARGGVTVDSLVLTTGFHWQYVAIPITDSVYFDSLFQFRFRNYCSLTETAKPGFSGNCDFWHLDYFFLDTGRTAAPSPLFHDVAFVDPAPSALANYRAMPACQYSPDDMAPHFDMTIANLFNAILATQYSYAVVDATGDTLFRYDGGYENAPTFLPGERYQTAPAHAQPPITFTFPLATDNRPASTEYTIVHVIREGSVGDDFPSNDTVRYSQVFDNYYAYDDGTSENGYGLSSTASHSSLAYRFDLNNPDTLTALDLYFNRSADGENERVPFRITVWEADDSGRPGSILYRDQNNRRPLVEGLNCYHRYLLETPLVVNGSIFVGFEQTNNYYINLGFDRSYNTADRIYYLTSNQWQQSILSGSLMLRPCFGIAATVGVAEVEDSKNDILIYPNPTSDIVHVKGLPEGSRIELFDASGRRVHSNSNFQFSIFNFPNGLYLLRAITPDGAYHTEKLIIHH